MVKFSAGILLYRRTEGIEVFLVHPGGPIWAKRDAGAWSIAKGEYDSTETAEEAARREFKEETGLAVTGPLIALGEARQPTGKVITAFACAKDFDVGRLISNSFEMSWPPKSGKLKAFPEVDRAAWFSLVDARTRLLRGQVVFLDRLSAHLRITGKPALFLEK